MNDFGKHDDEKPERGEAGSEGEPSSPPFYDPLMAPWDEPPEGGVGAGEPEEDPLFGADWATGAEEAPLWGPPTTGPGQAAPWQFTGYERGYGDTEGLTDLQRRLRQETVTVPRPGRRWGVMVREVVETLLLALLIFLAVRASFQNFRVEGASMMPSLDNGEYLIVNKLAYAEIDLSIFDWLPFYEAGEDSVHHLWAAPGRGDVIVFQSPTNVKRDFIKRIIGVPGDVVEISPEKSQVVVNGEVIDEPYVEGETSCTRECGPWTVPAGHYFVMGDNRRNSTDSRQGWFVPEKNIIGKALITYWNNGSPELELAPNYSVSLGGEASAAED